MILFPNAKINIGLRVLNRRADGYHNISTLMIPIGWSDILEIVPGKSNETTLTVSGKHAGATGNINNNLVMKALHALEDAIGKKLPAFDIYLNKNVPAGAGLGAGSADAAFTIKGLNDICKLNLSNDEMAQIANRVGADCPFFIYNTPMLAEGTGDILSEVNLNLNGLWLLVVKAGEGVSTKEAYAGVKLHHSADEKPLGADSINNWNAEHLVNDFEASVFAIRPELLTLKEQLQSTDPLFCSMSGSGASIYGIYYCDKMAETAKNHILAIHPEANIFCGHLDFKHSI